MKHLRRETQPTEREALLEERIEKMKHNRLRRLRLRAIKAVAEFRLFRKMMGR